jgi:zinc transporter ZupT
VVVLVPIALGAPAVLVFVPPAMLFTPATLASGMQFATLVICLAAVGPMSLDGVVEFMLGVSDSALATVDVLGMKPRRRGEEHESS